jgi:uncharacterized protein YndB with AHSA1/START domain
MPDLTTLFGPTERTITRSGERRTVMLRRPYAATPAELWSAWTQPERLARWLGVISGERAVGGEVRLTMTPPDDDTAVLRIEACEEPHRLAVNWSWPGEQDSRVEVSLEPDGDSTVLTLRHSLVTDETAIDYGCGWEDFLNRLHELVADRDPAAVVFSDAQQQLVPHWRAAERL